MNIAEIGNEVKEIFQPNKDFNFKYIALEHVEQDTLHINGFASSTEVLSNKYFFKEGDILFGTLRPYLRKVVIASFDGVCSTEFAVVRAKKKTDREFLFYSLANPKFIEFATTNSNGARPRTKWALFSKFEITDHNERARKEIGRNLSIYDQLIENNKRRIELLEESAQQLYKEWFVRFRFPGHEHVKIIDGVPEGWAKGKVSDLGEVITGKTPSTKIPEYFGQDVPFIKTPDMHASSIIIEPEEYLSERGASTQANKYLSKFSILVACIGARLGVVSLNARKCQTNQQINAVIPSDEFYTFYSYLTLKDFREKLLAIGGGATMPNVNKSKFSAMKVILPPEKLLISFHELVGDSFVQMENLIEMNSKLAQARTFLLPKLMSGEIVV